MAAPSSYIIVGAGVFGASTALRLIQQKPSAKILLVDRAIPHHESASWDWSKVIRADYADVLYCRLSLEARECWRHDPLYSEFYHETGLIWVDEAGFSEDVIRNYVSLQADEKVRMVPVKAVRKLAGGLFEDADFGGSEMVFMNNSSGWVEAQKALSKVIESARKAGVEFIESDISRLTFDENQLCTGAQSIDGKTFLAQNVILATGAETARLLTAGAPHIPELHAGDRIAAAGLMTGVVNLDHEEAIRFRNAPVFLHAGGLAKGAIIPPTTDNELKITRDVSFTNNTQLSHGQFISLPPGDHLHVHGSLMPKINSELAITAESILGERARDMKIEGCRICWDAITPTQDFIISAHSYSSNLYIATGGSFHSWKFLPILGKYVEQMLQGSLPPELAKRWAWNCREIREANKRMVPSYDIADLKGGLEI